MGKLLVTGGAGFIGSECVRQAVKQGHTVTVIDKLSYAGDMERLKEAEHNFIFHKVDVTDRVAVQHVFESGKPDVIIHWAAESHVDRSIADPSPFLDTNVKGTLVLLDAARHCLIRSYTIIVRQLSLYQIDP